MVTRRVRTAGASPTLSTHLSRACVARCVWLDWVPSKVSVADLASREDGDAALLDALEGAGLAGAFDEVEFLLPPHAVVECSPR